MPNYISSEPQTQGYVSLQGQEFTLTTDEERRIAFDYAFDFRGDITIILQNGESLEGFLFNRELAANPPFIALFIKGTGEAREVLYSEVSKITFSGRDTADGKSYDAWKAKKQTERDAEAKRIEDEMKAQGLL
jgi:hypothetical protein